MVSMAVVIAVGLNAAAGQREVLGVDVGPSEDGAFWLRQRRASAGGPRAPAADLPRAGSGAAAAAAPDAAGRSLAARGVPHAGHRVQRCRKDCAGAVRSACGLADDGPRADAGTGLAAAGERGRRRYRRTKKAQVPRWWRTRKDPFETVWADVCQWLQDWPERTAKSLFQELQQKYPGQYRDGQLRTLQAHVQQWRARAIVAFDEQ